MIPLSDKLSNELNAQVSRELGNKILYRSFSSWCHVRGLKNIEKFFKGESDGEQGHADIFMKLLDDANVEIAIPDIPAKPSGFTSCAQIADLYESAEVETTDHLDNLMNIAKGDKNEGAMNLLADMLQEQIEEQGLTERFKNLVQQAGGNLILLDLAFEG